jgi:general secretion pathway protein D
VFRLQHRRSFPQVLLTAAFLLLPIAANAQSPSTAPAAIPAGIGTPRETASDSHVSQKQAREADDAYLEGAKHVEHNDLGAAERSFARAVQLNPSNRDYVLALASTREHHITELVQDAAKSRLLGDNKKADDFLAQARAIDPDNPVVLEHFGLNLSPWQTAVDPLKFPAADIASTLAGPTEFAPTAALQSFHTRSTTQDIIRSVYLAFGITVTFDASVTDNKQIRLDLDNVSFEDARRILGKLTHVFAVPVTPTLALIAKDTQETRDRLVPQIEETVYLPGVPSDEMSELANVARNIFDIPKVTASATGGDMVLRGDEPSLRLVNATFADMLDGGSDVQLDINLYEIDKTHMINIGAQLPSGASVFPLLSTAENLIAANQTIINEAISLGALQLNGIASHDLPLELALLISQNVSGASQFANLLTVFGSYTGLPFAGLSVAGTSTFNLLLNSSDVRILDSVTLRGGNRQALNFRSGTRYPVVTSTYSSGISSGLASQLSGLNVNGTSVAGLLAQYGLSSGVNTSIPTFQFEDLGLTLKTTPQVLQTGSISLVLDMKIEALAGGMLNSIPILNSRTLTSTVTVPVGNTALLVSSLSTNELRSLDGLPGLSELPGFQGTEKSSEHDRNELLITITPHIVRVGNLHIASRRLATPPAGLPSQ